MMPFPINRSRCFLLHLRHENDIHDFNTRRFSFVRVLVTAECQSGFRVVREEKNIVGP